MSNASAHDSWVRLCRCGFGLLTLVAVIVQLASSPNVVNFFSFFTIQSNIIAAAVLLVGAVVVPANSRTWDLVRGAAAIYMVLTGVIYNTLLAGLEESLQTTIPWVNVVLHIVVPLVMLIDFILIPPAHAISWREAMVWSLYPLVYFIYTLTRGAVVDWYPYPFLDPQKDGGYPQVLVFSVITLLGFLGATWLMTELSAWRLRHRDPAH
jgi:uncharacterized membrane protein